MGYTQLADQASLTKVTQGLTSHGYTVELVKTGAEALEKIQALIPKGASIMNGSSTTLQQIGFVEYLKTGKHGWNNLHEAVANEKDAAKQAELRKQALLSDYYLGSVHALVENGEFIIASNTGSQLPHVVYTSPNLIFVVSTKKIVPSLDEAFVRLKSIVMPLEDERMKTAYGMGTTHNKTVIFHGESAFTGRKITFILVDEDLGF